MTYCEAPEAAKGADCGTDLSVSNFVSAPGCLFVCHILRKKEFGSF